MDTASIEMFLHKLGLSILESRIFIYCTKYDSLSATSLARLLCTPRTTIHDHTEKMRQENLLIVKETTHGKTYSSIRVDQIIGLIERRKDVLNKLSQEASFLKPDFEIIASENKSLPKVKYYEGVEAIHMVYNKLACAKKSYTFFDIDACIQYSQRDLDHICNIIGKNTGVSKEILSYSKNALYYQRKIHSRQHQVKVLPQGEPLQSDTGWIDGMCYHITFGEFIVVVEIDNPIFFKSQKILFDNLWDRL